jgi:hypothetical protein
MDLSTALKILELGVIGLGFLLALLAYQLLKEAQKKEQPSDAVLRSVYFFMGFSVILCIIGVVSQYLDQRRTLGQLTNELSAQKTKYDDLVMSRQRLSLVSGRITKPTRGTVVGTTLECTGRVTGRQQGVHVWLAVEVQGAIWPKETELEVSKEGTWPPRNVFQDSSTPKFSLILLAADEDGHKRIEDWIDRGKRQGSYERIESVEGTIRLDRVEDLRLTETR